MKKHNGPLKLSYPDAKDSNDYILDPKAPFGAWVKVGDYSLWIRKGSVEIYKYGEEDAPPLDGFTFVDGE